MANADLEVLLKLKDEMSAEIAKANKSVGGLGKTLGDVGKMAAGFLAANVIGDGVSKFTGFLNDATEKAKVQAAADAQLQVALTSTSGAAGLTYDELKKMASGLQDVTNFGDEATQGAESLLLTFTSIGKDVFPDALSTVLDMSQALGQDLKSSSIQLGKALNDPITGVTALKRVGVSFNETQLDQIKTMQKSGDIMGAQKLILAELNKEFGGSAAAAVAADHGAQQYANRIGDLKERIGNGLIPIQAKWKQIQLESLDFLVSKVFPAIGDLASKYWPGVSRVLNNDAIPALNAANSAFRGVVAIVTDLQSLFRLGLGGGEIGGEMTFLQKAAFTFGAVFRDNLIPAFNDARSAVHLFLLALQGGDAGGNLSSMQAKFLQFGKDVRKSYETEIKPALASFMDIVKTLAQVIADHWDLIKAATKLLAEFMIAKIEGAIQVLHGIVEVVTGVVDLVDDLIHGRWSEAWTDLGQIVRGAVDIMLGYVREQFGTIPDLLVGTIKSGINLVIAQINRFLGFVSAIHIDIPSVPIPGIGSVGGGSVGMPFLPPIPMLAEGGIVTRPTLIMAGERGSEAIVPLNRGGIGGVTVNINAPVYGVDNLQRVIEDAVKQGARNGHFRGYLATA